MAELVYDWVRLPGGDDIEVLAAAVHTQHVRERLDLVARAVSREAERVGVGALPLVNLGAVIPEVAGETPIAILELGEERSELVVARLGYPLFARTLTIAVSGLPQSAPELAARLRQT